MSRDRATGGYSGHLSTTAEERPARLAAPGSRSARFGAATRAWLSALRRGRRTDPVPPLQHDAYGAIVRGNVRRRRIALLFAADRLGEGAPCILAALRDRRLEASFFVTGGFLRDPALAAFIPTILDHGHYLGPHSDGHLRYCDPHDHHRSLVTEAQFADDLGRNIADLKALGARDPMFFLPPYETHNADHVAWGGRMGVRTISYSPGTGSNRDYAPEGDPAFVPAQAIYRDVLACEAAAPEGLNGFLLLLHLGSGRRDPFHPLVGALCDELRRRSYAFVRVDDLLAPASRPGSRA